MPLLSNSVSSAGGSGSADPLILAATTASVGQLQQPAGTPLLHTYGSAVAGEQNLFLGQSAGNFTLSGALRNIGLGYRSCRALTSGDNNIGIGYRSLYSVNSGASNIAIGYDALVNLDVGARNIALGQFAGAGLANAADNIAIGYNTASSGLATRTGTVSIGSSAGLDSTANYGISIGQDAGLQLIGEGSIAVGYQSLFSTVATAEKNIAIGYKAGTAVTTGKNNTAVGYLALESVTTGINNTGIGAYAGDKQVIAGHDNTIVGNYAGAAASNTSDYSYTVFVGTSAGSVLTGKGNNAVGIGYLASANSNANNYVAIGYNAGRNLIGDGSIAIGYNALDATTTGASGNTAIGYEALTALTTATNNTAIGYQAGKALTTGVGATIFGYQAGLAYTNASNVVVIGNSAANIANSSQQMKAVIIGSYANYNRAGGNDSVILGHYAGANNGAGTENGAASSVCIGEQAGSVGTASTDLTSSVFIGYYAGYNVGNSYNGTMGNMVGIGTNALRTGIGDGSVAIGCDALRATVTGAAGNTAVGYQAGKAITTGVQNTVIGYDAGGTFTSYNYNTFVGYRAGNSTDFREKLTAIGCQALESAPGGNESIAIGYQAGMSSAGGGSIQIGNGSLAGTSSIALGSRARASWSYSVVLGDNAARNGSQSGTGRNVVIGRNTFYDATTANHNVSVGYGTGYSTDATTSITTGSKNTFLGSTIDVGAAARIGSIGLGYKTLVGADYVAVFGAADGAGNANGELNAIGVGTTAPTLFWQIDERTGMTQEGGFAVKLTNKTGANSVKGDVVCASSTTDNAFQLIAVDVPDPIGVVYTSGVADGSDCWVVVSGRAQVNYIAAVTRKYLARGFITGDAGYVAGKAMAEAVPASPFATDKHFYEIGHVLETTGGAGLAYTMLHFN